MKFIKESFIPKNDLSLALVDKRVSKSIEKKFNELNIKLIKTYPVDEVYDAIKYHPDISVCKLDYNNIVVSPNVYDYYTKELKKYNFNVIKGNSTLQNKYPKNIQYNACIFGNFAVHNFKYTDKNIIEFIEKNNITKINVSQGYSKCNICVVDENSIITSDIGIYNEVIKYDIDCLLIDKGHIDLFNLNYGFIGGCSGLISNDTLAFLGNIKLHPNYYDIYKFVKLKNKNIISLGNENLIDLGSIIPITTY